VANRYDPDAARAFLEEWLVRDEGDETRAFCPLCEEPGASHSPSASFNFADNKWNCLKTDGDGGSIAKLIKTLEERESGANVRTIRRNVTIPTDNASALSEDDAEQWHTDLLARPELVEKIENLRGWDRSTLVDFMIGYHRNRYTIPIYDADGRLVNIRQYKPGDELKFINAKGHGKNRIWGFDTLEENDTVMLCAGEPDRILAVQEGFPAVTWTGGEGSFQPEWAPLFTGKIVYVALDADDAGRAGTEKVITALQHTAAEIWVVTIPEVSRGYDITDVLFNDGPEGLQRLLDAAEQVEAANNHPITETDHGNALRLIDSHSERFRHIADMGRWHHWDSTKWALDVNNREVRNAHIDLAHQLPEGGFKRNALSRGGITSAIGVAELDERISILTRQLDAYPELLNTPGGIDNLRTGEVIPFDPRYLLSRSTAYAADMSAPHPKWDQFLSETFPGSDQLVSYLQRLYGLALVGEVREQILPFLYGTGANGKGVVTLVLQGLLGDADNGGYAVSAPDGFLLAGRDNAHPTEIARLRGARLVVCSEQSSGKKFDEVRVKKFTGGDRLTGRWMGGNFFDFDPSHLLWVMSNHLPAVKEGGPSFWRRVRLIPFSHVVPEDKRVLDLHQQLLDSEGPAILGWAVRGAVDVLANGLRDPAEVVKATYDYQVSEDTLSSFIRDECELGGEGSCKVGDFTARYRQHCEEMDAEVLSSRALTMRLMSEYNIERARNGSGRIYKGVALSGKLSASK
jgi:putative DNA primase/helicase